METYPEKIQRAARYLRVLADFMTKMKNSEDQVKTLNELADSLENDLEEYVGGKICDILDG